MKVKDKDIEKGILPRKFAKISQFILQKTIRSILFFMGYYYMTKKEVKFDEKKYKKLKRVCSAQHFKKPFLILQNHSCTQDIFWDLYLGNRCFVSKKSVKNYPIIGYFNWILQSILVDRENSKEREKTMNQLNERIKKMSQNQRYNHLVIFGEGVTTVSNKIIKFKRGIFSLNYPIKIEGLRYQGRIDNTLCMMRTIQAFVAVCCNFQNEFTHYELDSLIEPAHDMPWEEYAEEVRDLMCNEFGFEKAEGRQRDKGELYQKLTGRKLRE